MIRYIGMDFSGDADQWRARCATSNVWLAVVENGESDDPILTKLCRVRELPGFGAPFERLVSYLSTTGFTAAGIDAPFSIPAEFVPRGSHSALLETVAGFQCGSRPFAQGYDLVKAVLPDAVPNGRKVFRRTDALWLKNGVTVRSTIWNGPRGGAPFTVACLTLLKKTGLPAWPWVSCRERLLVEAFPAAQLRTWGLPHQGYNGSSQDALAARRLILDGIKMQTALSIPVATERAALENADALDAILAAFAGKAVAESALAFPPASEAATEGWIAVHNSMQSDTRFPEIVSSTVQATNRGMDTAFSSLRTQQIGKLGELLVQYELLRFGLESAPMTTDAGVDLVVYSPARGRSFTIQVKANLKPKPGGGKGAQSLDWWVGNDCSAELYAFVDLSSRRIWLFQRAELQEAAQQFSNDRHHLYMYVEPVTRTKHSRVRDTDFSEFLIESRIRTLFL